MKTYVNKTAAALTIGFISLAALGPVKANDLEFDTKPRVTQSLAIDAAQLEKPTSPGVMQIVSTIGKEVKLEEVKGVFNTIKQKTQDELDAYQVKTMKKPSFWKSFIVGFKHGFLETIKAAVKVAVKAAPAILALI